MAEYFSNHYRDISADGTNAAVAPNGMFLAPTGYGELTRMKKRARLTIANGVIVGDNEVMGLIDFDSSDRIEDIFITTDGNFGASSDVNIGLYKSQVNGGGVGVVIDEDLFGAVDITGIVARTAHFLPGALGNLDRGKALWQLADIGGGSYSEDPHETWTLAFTADGALGVTVAVAITEVEVQYDTTA